MAARRADGGDGADVLIGGARSDNLFGGGADADVDVFRFADDGGSDQIWDFEDGVDKIDLTLVTGLDEFAQ